MYSRQYTYTDDGKPRLIFEQVGLATVTAYLVDWSAPEFSIRGAGVDVIEAAVKQLDGDDFDEIKAAIDAHVQAMADERAAEKKTAAGASASSATSLSLVGAAGATSG